MKQLLLLQILLYTTLFASNIEEEITKLKQAKCPYYYVRDLENLNLRKNKAFMIAAIKEDGGVIDWADKSLSKDREFILAAVQSEGGGLNFADESLKKDREVVLVAVKNDGFALCHADESFKKDKEIVLIAVNEDGRALECANKSLQKDKEIIVVAQKKIKDSLKEQAAYIEKEQNNSSSDKPLESLDDAEDEYNECF